MDYEYRFMFSVSVGSLSLLSTFIRSVFYGWISVHFWNLKWDRFDIFVENEKESGSAV